MKLVFELILEGKIKLYVSPTLKDEVLEKLQFFGVNTQVQNEVMAFIDHKGISVTPIIKIDICEDKDDNFNLELSETADEHFLVTRDRKLLKLKQWKKTTIINPDDFLPLLRKMKLLE
jgi:putative PIN family toxin of toxin-antitoxin system